MKRALQLLIVLAVLINLNTTAHALIAYSDGTFNPADWSFFSESRVNGGSVVFSQQTSGGNPTNYRRIVNTVNRGANSGIWGFHLNNNAIYNLAVEGAILSIDYMEDSRMFTGFGDGQASGPALRQNGKNYYHSSFGTNFQNWQTQSVSDLDALDFLTLSDVNDHPDFSSTANQIKFGFFRANSTTGRGYTIDGGIDNWRVNITPVPEPSSMLLLSFGLLGAGLFRRKKKA